MPYLGHQPANPSSKHQNPSYSPSALKSKHTSEIQLQFQLQIQIQMCLNALSGALASKPIITTPDLPIHHHKSNTNSPSPMPSSTITTTTPDKFEDNHFGEIEFLCVHFFQ